MLLKNKTLTSLCDFVQRCAPGLGLYAREEISLMNTGNGPL